MILVDDEMKCIEVEREIVMRRREGTQKYCQKILENKNIGKNIVPFHKKNYWVH